MHHRKLSTRENGENGLTMCWFTHLVPTCTEGSLASTWNFRLMIWDNDCIHLKKIKTHLFQKLTIVNVRKLFSNSFLKFNWLLFTLGLKGLLTILSHSCSPTEALQAFNWFSKAGNWNEHFSAWERWVAYATIRSFSYLSQYTESWFSLRFFFSKSLPSHRYLVVYVGAMAMWVIGKRLKKRYNLKVRLFG